MCEETSGFTMYDCITIFSELVVESLDIKKRIKNLALTQINFTLPIKSSMLFLFQYTQDKWYW